MNYFVPVDARLERDTDVRFEAVTLDDVLAATEGAGLRVVILDACRNQTSGAVDAAYERASEREPGELRGILDESLLGDETLVALCGDGGGRGGPEQPVHVGAAGVPGAAAGDRASVPGGAGAGAGGDRERPHEYASLLGEHYLWPRRERTRVRWRRRWAWTVRVGVGCKQGLSAAGFSPGPADGVSGSATRAAIRGWQTSSGRCGSRGAGSVRGVRAGRGRDSSVHRCTYGVGRDAGGTRHTPPGTAATGLLLPCRTPTFLNNHAH